jgi:multidrug resistance protein, MATE family
LRRWRADFVDLWRLAVPVVVARAGIMTMQLADTVVVARYAAEHLAWQSIANAVTGGLIATLIGLLHGTGVMAAQAYGARRFDEAGAVWRRGASYATVLGVGALVISLFGEELLLAGGQAPGIAAGGGKVIMIFGLALPAVLLSTSITFFLEGIRRPLPGMIVMIGGNVLNAVLNVIFVFGHFGLPEGGAIGSAWATTIVRYAMLAALLVYFWRMKDAPVFGLWRRRSSRWADGAAQRRVGYGAAVAIGVECASFAMLTLFAGWLGILPLAASSIILNLIATIFMTALGLGAATGVRVGIATGRRDPAAVARAGWTGLLACVATMACFSLALAVGAEPIVGLYTNDVALAAVAIPVLALCALMLVPDGGQVVMAHALRGRGDNFVPSLLHTVSYLILMLPLSWWLAFPKGRGLAGLWEGAIVASVFSVGVLALRFAMLNLSARRGFTSQATHSEERTDARRMEPGRTAETA